MEENRKCCFCGKEIEFPWWENNPSPANTNPDAVCCNECNWRIVVPSRVIINDLICAGKKGETLNVITVPDYTHVIDAMKLMDPGEQKYVYNPITETWEKA